MDSQAWPPRFLAFPVSGKSYAGRNLHMKNHGLTLLPPRITPPLDPFFRPAALAHRQYRREVEAAGGGVAVLLALEQSDGSVFHYPTRVFSDSPARAQASFVYLERLVKFLLWSRGGF